jgi:hypothetical protein
MMRDTGITSGTAGGAALGVDGPQPVWMTLNQARERAFTGEIVFETDPEVHAYLDNGTVYYAERASDVSLGRRLLEAGVVDIEQLRRGIVRVGDVEHLGRLFDRDPSVDRHAVIVMAETVTEQLVAELANQSTATVRATAYRHHPSGLHRWFVTQTEPAPMVRPVSTVAQYDMTVLDALSGLPFADNDAAELIIEWDTEPGHPSEFRADVFDLSPDVTDVADVTDVDEAPGSAIDERYIETIDELYFETIEDPYTGVLDDRYVGTVDRENLETVEELQGSGTEEETSREFEFSVVWPDGSAAPEGRPTNEARTEPVGGFSPPTKAMRAEVMFGQLDDAEWTAPDARRAVTRATSPGSGTPMVFAEDLVESNSSGEDERRSALRRLIGSLRRKDP